MKPPLICPGHPLTVVSCSDLFFYCGIDSSHKYMDINNLILLFYFIYMLGVA